MDQPEEIELVFAPQEEGGYHVYAPDLPGLHSQGDTLEEATTNAQEALELLSKASAKTAAPSTLRDSASVPHPGVSDALPVVSGPAARQGT
jgi:predicted RNase H-like HicB family nuclease